MYAIVLTGGKQYKVEAGKYFKAEKVDAQVGQTVELDCLLVNNDGKVTIGNPTVAGVKAVCEVLEHGKEDKVIALRYKAKKNERKRQGHRQPYSKLKVVSIG
jgi:large subunit ribosomal protein L21